MALINCKAELSLKWIENCLLTRAAIGANANAAGTDNATFQITDTKLSCCYFTNRRQCKICKTIKSRI